MTIFVHLTIFCLVLWRKNWTYFVILIENLCTLLMLNIMFLYGIKIGVIDRKTLQKNIFLIKKYKKITQLTDYRIIFTIFAVFSLNVIILQTI